MTTLNTIIEEEKKRFDLLWAEDDEPRLRVFAKDFLTTAMQRVAEAVRAEERENIRKILVDYPPKGGINAIHIKLLEHLRSNDAVLAKLTPDKTPEV